VLGTLLWPAANGSECQASPGVQLEEQRTFLQRVVHRYLGVLRDSGGMQQAVFLHQSDPEHCLFGWCFRDGTAGRRPLFLAHTLRCPLDDILLQNVLTLLGAGPQQVPLERPVDLPLPDLWTHRPVRPGVMLPPSLRRRYYVLLQQGQSIDLFVTDRDVRDDAPPESEVPPAALPPAQQAARSPALPGPRRVHSPVVGRKRMHSGAALSWLAFLVVAVAAGATALLLLGTGGGLMLRSPRDPGAGR
jgi:hypothetical protein